MRALPPALTIGLAIAPIHAAAQTPAREIARLDATRHDLSQIDGFVVADDGTLYLPQSQDGTVRIFSTSFAELGRFGRTGAGPGEYRAFSRAGLSGGRFWSFDQRLQRLTVVGADRKVAQTVPTRPALTVAHAGDGEPLAIELVTVVGLYSDSTWLVTGTIGRSSALPDWFGRGASVSDRPVLRVHPDGRLHTVVARIPTRVCSVTDGSSSLGLAYCAKELWGVSPDASHVAYVRQGSTDELVVVRSDGSVLATHAVVGSRRPMPPRFRQQRLDELAKQLESLGPARVAAWRRLPHSTMFPPAARVLVGIDGTVALEHSDEHPDNRWTVYPRSGTPRTIVVPGNVQLVQISASEAYAVATDRDELQHVVRLSLSPR
ncbi:MAG TPA: hypothetical protein VFN90_00085 [Gemmatimonadales bacterium]|nr:hypothetical protein [Gemmatimonadales bacterium]